MKRKNIEHCMNGLMTLTTFSIFAVCVLMVLHSGVKAYSQLTQRDRSAYNRRTCIQYMAERVRSADRVGAISIERFGDTDALVVRDGEYLTRVYCLDGSLRELYCAAEHAAKPEEGERIIDAERMNLSLHEGMLTITLTAGGRTDTLCLTLRSGEKEAAA